MAKDPIKKADNGTYYFRANLGYDTLTGKQIQKYQSGVLGIMIYIINMAITNIYIKKVI